MKYGTTRGHPGEASTSAAVERRLTVTCFYFETPDCNLVALNLKDGAEAEEADLRPGSSVFRTRRARCR